MDGQDWGPTDDFALGDALDDGQSCGGLSAEFLVCSDSGPPFDLSGAVDPV